MRGNLCIGLYENVTPPGMDGTAIQFPFMVTIGSKERQARSRHVLIVSVAARITWGDDGDFLARVLFAVGVQTIIGMLNFHADVPAVVTAFVPHGDCPVNPDDLIDPNGAVIELDLPFDL